MKDQASGLVRSLVPLDVTHPVIRDEVRDVQRMHARVESMTDGHPEGPGRTLWAHPDPSVLIVQSTLPVGAHTLPRGATVGREQTVEVHRPEAGDDVVWSVISCPVRIRTEPDGRKRRVPVDEPDRDPWLLRRLEPAADVAIAVSSRLPSRRGFQAHSGRRLTFVRHLWSGTATVTDPDLWWRLMTCGVGPAKGYGHGLLVVSR